MTTVNLRTLSRTELEDTVMKLSSQVTLLCCALADERSKHKKLEQEYETLADVTMTARAVLNSGLTE